MKKIFILVIILISICLFFSCESWGDEEIPNLVAMEDTIVPGGTITIYDEKEVLTVDEIEKNFNNIHKIKYYPRTLSVLVGFYFESKDVYFYYSSGSPLKIKEKLGKYKAIYYLPINVSFSHDISWSNHIKRIEYPKYLTFTKDNVKVDSARIGDIITVTSDKPFFDPDTFTEEKMNKLFNLKYEDYYSIVWLSVDDKKYGELFCSRPDIVGAISVNLKCPLPKKYYKEITPYSITFEIPPSAKSGELHVLNEGVFNIDYSYLEDPNDLSIFNEYVNTNWDSEDKCAFFASKEDLIIVE